jgi:phytanoyl-CoA hydroxylase
MSTIQAADLSVDYSCADQTALDVSDSRAKDLLRRYGCFLARELMGDEELEPLRESIQEIINLRMEQAGLREEPPMDGIRRFDDGFARLCRQDCSHYMVVVSVIFQEIQLHQLGLNPKLVRLSKLMMATEHLVGSTFNSMQVQFPNEDHYLHPWHQDYHYVQDSEDAVVYWIPLRDLDVPNGALRVAPGSHQLGILPMRSAGPSRPNGYRPLKFADPSVLEQFPQITVHANAGDVLVFSTLLLHASAVNRSPLTRWTIQIRHGNLKHPRAIERGWPGARPEFAPFEQSHPDYFINEPNDEGVSGTSCRGRSGTL